MNAHLASCETCRRLAFVLATETNGPERLPQSLGSHSCVECKPGDQIDRFVVEGTLGQGAMGIVYAAHDSTLGRRVAIKVLRFASSPLLADARERLLREAQGLARISHPNVVSIYEAGRYGEQVFFAMEWVNGVSLDTWLAQGPRSWRRVAEVFAEAARGIAAAHQEHMIHRDIKPHNIMVSSHGVKIVDFGLVRGLRELEDAKDEGSESADFDVRVTVTGAIVGTPAYTSPEQLMGAAADERSDLFAFCATLYEALFGTRPFQGNQPKQLLSSIRLGIRLPSRPRVPASIRRLLVDGLDANPDERDRTLKEAADILESAIRRRSRMALIGIGTLSIVAAAVLGAQVASSSVAACASAQARFDEAWSIERRRAVRDAMMATNLPFAEDTWQAVEEGLDAYGNHWTTVHAATCRATQVEKTQSARLLDRKMACLEQHLKEADASIVALLSITSEDLSNAVTLVGQLPSPKVCTESSYVLGIAEPPADEGAQQELATLTTLFSAAKAQYELGNYQRSLDALRSMIDRVQATGYRPFEAKVQQLFGRAHNDVGNPKESSIAYKKSVQAAIAGGDLRVQAESLLGAALRFGEAGVHEGEVEDYIARANAVIERMGGDAALEAELLYVVASRAATMTGEIALARQTVVEALDLLEGLPAQEIIGLRLRLLGVEASTYDTYDNLPHALELLGHILSETEDWLGPQHPQVATTLGTMAHHLYRLDREVEAAPLLERMQKILRASGPRGEVEADYHAAAHEVDPAKKLHFINRALEGAERLYPGHLSLSVMLQEKGDALVDLQRHKEAIAPLTRAVAMVRSLQGDDGPNLPAVLISLGDAQLGIGELAAAGRSIRTAIAQVVKDPERATEVKYLHFFLLRVLALEGNWQKVSSLADELLAFASSDEHIPSEALHYLRFVQAVSNWHLGHQPTKNRAIARRAKQQFFPSVQGRERSELNKIFDSMR